MWKGLKKALGHRAKAQKTGPSDVSIRSTSSAGQSSHGALFALDVAEDAMVTASDSQDEQQHQQQPVASAALTWALLQQQRQQQHAVQQLVQQAEDSTSKRRAAAMQKRVNNSMLNPSTCLYQISSLLSLSTLFEHKLQRDTLQALQQQPSNLVSSIASSAAAQQQQQQLQQQHQASKLGQQQQMYDPTLRSPSTAGTYCCYCQGTADDSVQGSFCCCQSGGAASLRTPSATAASTAHVALLLASWGYRVIVRKVLHSKAYWTKSMDNTFIVALDSSSGNHVEYIVDPHFQEAFNVGVMSDNYRTVWQALPRVFVGMPCQLQSAIQLLCEEMELSFLEAGRPCPPWRGWAATINRWMSDQFVDILVPEPGASSEEVAEYLARCTQLSPMVCTGPGSSVSETSTATRGSSTAISTCSPPGGNVSQQRLGDKVHVSSVLSSVSGAREQRVPEPLQKQLGFAADAAPQQQQQQDQQDPQQQDTPGEQELQHGAGQQQQDQQQPGGGSAVLGRVSLSSREQAAHCPSSSRCTAANSTAPPLQLRHACIQDASLARRSASSSSSFSSSGGSSDVGQSASSSRSKSLLTAQMQYRQRLELQDRQQQQLHLSQSGAALQQSWLQQQQEQLLLLQQQQQQQLLVQQLALQQQQGHVQGQQLQLQQMQLLLQQQHRQQQQQQPALGGCGAALLPVVHTVRPCGAPPAVPPSAVAMHAAAMQQLLPIQQRQEQQQQQQQQSGNLLQSLQQGYQQQQQQQGLQLQPGMHNGTQEQPRLLRLIPRNKAA